MDRALLSETTNGAGSQSERLSYKFQRLRERLRRAVLDRELAGKLPGERELARRFQANPKTISKALTDLAAEGLLERTIGRGTYVQAGVADEQPAGGKALILCDHMESPLARRFRASRPGATAIDAIENLRPSFLSQFQTVIDLSNRGPDHWYRGLLVRGMRVLRVGREPAGCKVNAVLLDRSYAASRLARDLALAGHRRIVVVGASDDGVADAARLGAGKYGDGVETIVASEEQVPGLLDAGPLGIVCGGMESARRLRPLSRSGVSIRAFGLCDGEAEVAGIYVTAGELDQAAQDILRVGRPARPTVLYLAGQWVEAGGSPAAPSDATAGEGVLMRC